MRKSILPFILLCGLAASCVSPRVVNDLKSDLALKEARLDSCNTSLEKISEEFALAEEKIDQLMKQNQRLESDTSGMGTTLRKLRRLNKMNQLAYENLLKTNKQQLSEKEKKTQELLFKLNDLKEELEVKEKELTEKQRNLRKKDDALESRNKQLENLQADLNRREEKVKELEGILAKKDSTVEALKQTVSKALYSFKDNGLSVELKNSKVYVTLADRLLFESGSYRIDKQGKEALLEIARVLKENQDVSIMVEGHTDDVPVIPGSKYQDNWDLSVLRATEVVRFLSGEGKIAPERLEAAGKGPYSPVMQGKTDEARKKNRRTEIILTPKLDKLFEILEK